tara:strand:- start:882 stop:1436 length:555 start_codon:yes stop_codon:yes gene_type:complete
MAFNINTFQSELRYGGARPALFEVLISNPINAEADDRVRFFCKTAEIPASTINPITTNYFGREVKIAGNRTFADWAPTIINDEDFAIRATLEQWSQSINNHIDNVTTAGLNPTLYKGQADIIHYGKDGRKLRQYHVSGMFPTELGAIELSWDNGDQLEEYTATFSIDYWTVQRPGEGLGITITV